jgi:hypothetical protein
LLPACEAHNDRIPIALLLGHVAPPVRLPRTGGGENTIIGNTGLEACCKRHARYRSYSTVLPIRLTVVPSKAWRERLVRAETPNRIGKSTIADAIRYANDGGEHWAIVASLIETCKMNGFARLVWVLAPPPAPVQDDASTAPPANNPLKHTSCARSEGARMSSRYIAGTAWLTTRLPSIWFVRGYNRINPFINGQYHLFTDP